MWRARAGRHLLLGGHRRELRGQRPGLELLSLQHVPGAAEAQFHQLPPHLLALREGKHRQGALLATRHRGRAPHNSHRPRTPTASASGGRHLAARWSVGPSAPAAPGRSRWCGRCRDGPGPAPVLSRGPRTHTSAPSRGHPPLRRGRTPRRGQQRYSRLPPALVSQWQVEPSETVLGDATRERNSGNGKVHLHSTCLKSAVLGQSGAAHQVGLQRRAGSASGKPNNDSHGQQYQMMTDV